MNSREAVDLPDPATPALHGDAWWKGRPGVPGRVQVLEQQRQMDSADLAEKGRMIDYLRGEVKGLHMENARLRADLAKAGRDLDDLTRREAAGRIEVVAPAARDDAGPAEPGRKVVGSCTGGFADGAGFGPIYEGEPLDLSAREIREAQAIPPGPADPGPFGIDTPDYSDRDREMFVLGYEFSEASRDIRLVTAGDIPACRVSSWGRTIHDANLIRLLRLAEAAGLDYKYRRSPDGWCLLHVRRKDA